MKYSFQKWFISYVLVNLCSIKIVTFILIDLILLLDFKVTVTKDHKVNLLINIFKQTFIFISLKAAKNKITYLNVKNSCI